MTIRYPKHLMIELTDRCNLKCMICVREEYEEAISGPGFLMSLEDLKKLESPIRDAETITVTGFGETLLHPDLKSILSYIYSINPSENLIKIVTNGTALNAEKAEWFAGHLHTMSISLNASNANSYGREMHPYEHAEGRDLRNKFDRLLERISAFTEVLSPNERKKVHLHYVVHGDNISDLADFVRLAHKLGLSTVQFTHLMVHREQHIDRSIYWKKDEYNDAVDEALEAGLELGVTVGARKFFTERQQTFVAERDCTWPLDTTIVGVKGRITPCCYWGSSTDIVGNAFAKPNGFNEAWFGDYYDRLRKKRIGSACKTCNILRTFDDITLHFSPYLKSKPAFAAKLAEFEKTSKLDMTQISGQMERAGLDAPIHRWTLRQTNGDMSPLFSIEMEASNPLDEVEKVVWEGYREQNAAAETSVTVNVADRFLGVGWGPSGRNEHGQAWRWLGGHGGNASIFLRLSRRHSYSVEVKIYTAKTTHALQSLHMFANGKRMDTHYLHRKQNDPYQYFSSVIPNEVLQHTNGYVQISFGTDKISKQSVGELDLAFSSVTVSKIENPSAAQLLSKFHQIRSTLSRLRQHAFN